MTPPRPPAAPRARLPDYYDALGVSEDASFRDIELAYWRLARERRDILPLLNEAYEVLSHGDRREAYDAVRKVQPPERKREPVVRPAPLGAGRLRALLPP